MPVKDFILLVVYLLVPLACNMDIFSYVEEEKLKKGNYSSLSS